MIQSICLFMNKIHVICLLRPNFFPVKAWLYVRVSAELEIVFYFQDQYSHRQIYYCDLKSETFECLLIFHVCSSECVVYIVEVGLFIFIGL
jgi:hypothetical protein